MKSIIITGASSGIGRQLALEFANIGFHVGLLARRFELLQTLREEIRALKNFSGKVEIAALDVRDYKSVFYTVKDVANSLGGISHLVVNSGVAGSKEVGSNNFLQDKHIIEVNVVGAMATVEVGAQIFQSQQSSGHIIGISSVAGFRGFPMNASYSASKAAFTNYLEAARIDLAKKNILVTSILPGFINTDMNSHLTNRPFVISVEKGAAIIRKKILQRKSIAYIPGFPWALISYFIKRIPDFIWNRISF